MRHLFHWRRYHPLRWIDKTTTRQPFLCAMILLLMIMVPAWRLVENRAYVACERDNALRKAYVDQWSPILAESPVPQEPPPGSPKAAVDSYNAQIETRRLFEESLTNGFAQHPC